MNEDKVSRISWIESFMLKEKNMNSQEILVYRI